MLVSRTLTSISYFPNFVSSRIHKDYCLQLKNHRYFAKLDNGHSLVVEGRDGAVLTDQLGTPRGRCDELSDASVLMNQLGTPRGGCEEHNSKFSLSYETKV
jgi:hypothetical protein